MPHDDALSLLGRDLVAVGRLWRRVISQRLAAIGVPDAQWLVLDNLNRSGDRISQKTVAKRLGLEQSALVRVLKELEASGYIERIPAPEDTRSRICSLTDEGRKIANDISAMARRFDETILAGFTTTEMKILLRQLRIMRQRISDMDHDG